MNRYVVEVERNGVRDLYGPTASIQEARALSDRFLAGRGEDEVMVVRIRHLSDPPWVNLPAVNPNQITIQEHIAEIHDAVL